MKKSIGAGLFLVFLAFLMLRGHGVIKIKAQSLPVTVHAEWNQNPASENVVDYLVSLDGVAALPVPNTLNVACGCIKSGTFSINDTNTHTFALQARNTFGLISATTNVVFAVTIPSNPKNATVKPGS